MAYKRQEGFRFVFKEPLKANISVFQNSKRNNRHNERAQCEILDISPHGMKIMTEINIKEHEQQDVQFEIDFILDTTIITVLGTIVWSKVFGTKFQYGLILSKQPAVEALIIEELKTRRRKEMEWLKSMGRTLQM